MTKTMIFVLSVLYLMDEKWRGIGSSQSFENILKNRRGVNLHLAWLKLIKEGLLGEFSDEFWFDVLYGISNLNEILSVAVVHYQLVRLGGSDLCYHLDYVSPEIIKKFLRDEQIPIETVQAAAARLNELLYQQADRAKSSTHSV